MINVIQDRTIIGRRLIKQSSRFRTECVATADGNFLLKTALKSEFNRKVRQQLAGAAKLNWLLIDVSWLTAEKIMAHGENWLAVEWLPYGPLFTKEALQASQNQPAFEKFIEVVAQLDELAVAHLNETHLNPIKLSRHRLEPQVYSQKVIEKFQPFLNRSEFDEKLIKSGLGYFEQRISSFEACYQHGDLTPWHIFKKGGQLVIVDCEHVSDDWPRFYDIANFYSKLNVEFDLSNQSEKMMDIFARIRQHDARASDAFWAVVILRSLRRTIEHQSEPDLIKRAFMVVDRILSV